MPRTLLEVSESQQPVRLSSTVWHPPLASALCELMLVNSPAQVSTDDSAHSGIMMGLANANLNRTFTLAEAGRGLSPFTEERALRRHSPARSLIGEDQGAKSKLKFALPGGPRRGLNTGTAAWCHCRLSEAPGAAPGPTALRLRLPL